jgi:uncharacterized protein
MLCPACQVDLLMTERQGIEIDYCPRCRGVWLDRGELDKIIDRSNVPPGMTPPMAGEVSDDYRRGDRRDERQGQHPGQYQKRKREGFFSDLFDWD